MRVNLQELRAIIHESLLNAYGVLGVPQNASEDQIKAAWKKLALQNHPDRGGSHGKMVDINNAKDRLLDKTALFRYGPSIKGYEMVEPAAAPRHAPPATPPSPRPQSRSTPPPAEYVCAWCRRKVPSKRVFDGSEVFVVHSKSPSTNQVCPGSMQWVHTRSSDRDAESAPRTSKKTGPTPERDRDSYKVYTKKAGRRVIRVGGKLYGTDTGGQLDTGEQTRFKANDRVRVSPERNGAYRVKDPKGDHSQVWNPVDEVRQVVDAAIIDVLEEIARR